MFSYHNRIKRRIKAGELEGYEFVDDYPGIGECMVLHFNTYPPTRTTRPRRWLQYVDLLWAWKRKKEAENGDLYGR